MSLDVDQLRLDTPGAMGQHFLDAAGSALPPAVVTDTVIAHLRREAEVGGYVAAYEAEGRLQALKRSLASLAGTQPHNVTVTTSATASFIRALQAVPLAAGDRVLTTRAEYANNVLPLLQLQRTRGITVEFIPDGPDGAADPAAMTAMLDERVKLIVITHAASQNGLLTDAAGFGAALRAAGSDAWYLLDACQSVGQVPVDMAAIGCDFLSATGRKWLRAPRGTGFLAVSDRALATLEPVPPDMVGTTWDGAFGYTPGPGAGADRFRSFEISYAGLLGLGAAADYALAIGIDQIQSRIRELAASLRAQLAELPGVRVVDAGTHKTGIVVFSVPCDDGRDGPAEVARLRAQGITVVAVGPAVNPAHVATYGPGIILRASPHIYNTPADLSALCSALTT